MTVRRQFGPGHFQHIDGAEVGEREHPLLQNPAAWSRRGCGHAATGLRTKATSPEGRAPRHRRWGTYAVPVEIPGVFLAQQGCADPALTGCVFVHASAFPELALANLAWRQASDHRDQDSCGGTNSAPAGTNSLV